jgi:hypothetical protein
VCDYSLEHVASRPALESCVKWRWWDAISLEQINQRYAHACLARAVRPYCRQ